MKTLKDIKAKVAAAAVATVLSVGFVGATTVAAHAEPFNPQMGSSKFVDGCSVYAYTPSEVGHRISGFGAGWCTDATPRNLVVSVIGDDGSIVASGSDSGGKRSFSAMVNGCGVKGYHSYRTVVRLAGISVSSIPVGPFWPHC